MPFARRRQTSTSWLVELGNGDKFIFDLGTSCAANLNALGIPHSLLDKVFLTHLHVDHMGDLGSLYAVGMVRGRFTPLRVWGPSSSEPRLGTAAFGAAFNAMMAWDIESRRSVVSAGTGWRADFTELDYSVNGHVVFEENGVTVSAFPAVHCIDGPVSYRLDWNGLDHLFFTHLHTDHMMDYARLIHARWDENVPDLNVWGPAHIATISDRYFGPEGALAFDLRARTEMPQSIAAWKDRGGAVPRPWPAPAITEIGPGDVVQGEGWSVRAFEVPHAQPFLMCMGYRIEASDKVIVYAGDSGHTPELERAVEGADILIHWCYRLSHEPLFDPSFAATSPGHIETAEMAQRQGGKHLVLTHLRAKHDDPDTHARIWSDVG
jgi:ribonuclease Z